MGILDIASKVITHYKADVTDQVSGLKKLQGEEKQLAQEQLKNTDAHNRNIDKSIAGMAKFGLAIGAVTVAVRAGFAAIEMYGRKLDLQGAAGKVSIEGLSTAARGLKTDMELLEHAAKFNSGAFKLNQQQMEAVESAMFALEERGHSSEEVWSAFSTALTKGTTRSLEGLGIQIDKSGLALDENGLKVDSFGQKQEVVGRIIKGITALTKEGQTATLDAADEMTKSTNKLKNHWAEAQASLGKLAASLVPIIDLLAAAIGKVGWVLKMQGGGLDRDVIQAAIDKNGNKRLQGLTSRGVLASGGANDRVPIASGGSSWLEDSLAAESKAKPEKKTGGGGGRKPDPWVDGWFQNQIELIAEDRVSLGALNPNAYGSTDSIGRGALDMGGYGSLDLDAATGVNNTGSWNKRLEENAGSRDSKLVQMFGPLEEFNAYKIAFDTLGGAVSASMSAWIDGSMSAGKAFKAFVGEAVKGLAIQMAMESLKHGAYAIGSAAMGNFAGAALHAKSAAAFGVGAVLASVAAKSLSAGGGSGAPALGASVGGGGGRAPSAGQSQPDRIIVYSDAFAEDSARGKQLQAEKMVSRALGNSAVQRS